MLIRIFIYCLFNYFTLLMSVHADLNIDIDVGAEEGGQPIAIVPFGGMARPPQDLASIISNDLYRSGRFAPMPVQLLPQQPTRTGDINFANWQSVGMPHLVIGRIEGNSVGHYNIEFQLFDVYQGSQIAGFNYNASIKTLRQVAHQISDEIYKALLGERGVFGTQIAYVTVEKQGRQKEGNYVLYLADADGANPRTMLRSNEPIFSPSWSPDGQRITYVTYDTFKSAKGRDKQMAVYIQEVSTGKRHRVSIGKGLNAAPAWSPDGTKLALTLSKDGNPEIYMLHLHNGALTRMTYNSSIDTEPEWSPDGQSLIFTSDRSGNPQIYKISANGGDAQRVTFKGNYNARARFSPDGRKIVVLHNEGSGFQIAVQELEGGQMNTLSKTTLDESPSFAPNGSMVIYGTGSELAAVSVDGRVHQRLAVEMGKEVREPAWSPFNQ